MHAQLADVCRRVLFASQLEGWQLGRSRVFLRAGQLAQLEVRDGGAGCAWLPWKSALLYLKLGGLGVF